LEHTLRRAFTAQGGRCGAAPKLIVAIPRLAASSSTTTFRTTKKMPCREPRVPSQFRSWSKGTSSTGSGGGVRQKQILGACRSRTVTIQPTAEDQSPVWYITSGVSISLEKQGEADEYNGTHLPVENRWGYICFLARSGSCRPHQKVLQSSIRGPRNWIGGG